MAMLVSPPLARYEYATTAEARGINVIIAGAGGAAHLPGMVAALTPQLGPKNDEGQENRKNHWKTIGKWRFILW